MISSLLAACFDPFAQDAVWNSKEDRQQIEMEAPEVFSPTPQKKIKKKKSVKTPTCPWMNLKEAQGTTHQAGNRTDTAGIHHIPANTKIPFPCY